MQLYTDRLRTLLDDFNTISKASGYPTIEQKLALAQVYATLELAGQVHMLHQLLEDITYGPEEDNPCP